MDVKGIAWVGHVYQKFEAMCLEVKETMYEDTVKYVENQMQTVGANVKKFYSEVVQDLLPPSSNQEEEDEGEEVAKVRDLSAEQYSNVVICKKPITGMKIQWPQINLEKSSKSLKSPDISKITADTKKAESTRGNSRQHFEGASKSKNVNPKQILETETSLRTNPAGKDCEIFNKDSESLWYPPDIITTRTSTEEATWADSVMGSFNWVESEKKVGTDLTVFSIVKNSTGIEGTENRISPGGDLPAQSNAVDSSTIDRLDPQEGSSWYEDVACNRGLAGEVFVAHPGRSDRWTLDAIEGDNARKLDESCVLVREDELHIASHKDAKFSPYKKKIREVFSSRNRSSRKLEYKQLALHYRYEARTDQQENLMPTLEIDRLKLPGKEINEHDWELL